MNEFIDWLVYVLTGAFIGYIPLYGEVTQQPLPQPPEE